MDGELISLIPVVVLFGGVLLMSWITRRKKCLWYWDGINHCTKTQCGCELRIAAKNQRERMREIQRCPFCGKKTAVHPFVERTESRP